MKSQRRVIKIPYIKKITKCGDRIFVEKTWSSRYGTKGQILHVRYSGDPTAEKQQKVNERNAQKRYAMLIAANAEPGDYWITFTYRRGSTLPENHKEQRKQFDKYILRPLRKLYKKQGKKLRYILRLVSKEEGCRPHFHLFCKNDGVNLADFPVWEFGNPQIKIFDNRLHQTLGEYICQFHHKKKAKKKQEEKQEEKDIDLKISEKGRVSCSKNLIRPHTDYYIIKRPSWRDDPQIPKGYMIDPASIINGDVENPYTRGMYRYQSYVLVKIRKKE